MTSDKLIEMLKLQDTINMRVDPSWRTAERPWHRAIAHEVAEAQNHLGWKWWAKQEPNHEAAKLELVDIWHFILSAYLDNGAPNYADVAFDRLVEDWYNEAERGEYDFAEDLNEALDLLAQGGALAAAFRVALDRAGMTFDELHRAYVGKYVLNTFRQHNGYRQGRYIKTWSDGREDNDHLNELMAQKLDAKTIWLVLAARYATVLAEAQAHDPASPG